MTRVLGPAVFRMSAVVPSASIRPLWIDNASRTENCASPVRTFPLMRIVSGTCPRPDATKIKEKRTAATNAFIVVSLCSLRAGPGFDAFTEHFNGLGQSALLGGLT